MRQKLSFGLWTNIRTASELFSTEVSLGGHSSSEKGLLRVSSDSEGKLDLRIVDSEDQTVAFLEQGSEVPVFGGHWLRLSLLLQGERLSVQSEGGKKTGGGSSQGKVWHMTRVGQEEGEGDARGGFRGFRFLQEEPSRFGEFEMRLDMRNACNLSKSFCDQGPVCRVQRSPESRKPRLHASVDRSSAIHSLIMGDIISNVCYCGQERSRF